MVVCRGLTIPLPSFVLPVDRGCHGRRVAKLCEECAISEQRARRVEARVSKDREGARVPEREPSQPLVWCTMTLDRSSVGDDVAGGGTIAVKKMERKEDGWNGGQG